jgi:signal transduction histidine kinase
VIPSPKYDLRTRGLPAWVSNGSVTISWKLLPGSLRDEVDLAPGTPGIRSVRDVVVDAFAVLTAAGLGVASSLPLRADGPWIEVELGVGAASCVALLVRRRWPIALALVLVALSTVSLAVAGAAAVATFSAAVHSRFPPVAGIAALGIAGSVTIVWLHPVPEVPFTARVIIGVLVTVVLVGWGRLVRARRQLLVSLSERARLAESERAARAAEVRRSERARFAREMHDVLAHRMSLLSVHAGALEFSPGAPQAEIARAAGVIRSGVHQMLVDLREVIGVLREDHDPGEREPVTALHGIADLDALVAEARSAGGSVTLDRPDATAFATVSPLVASTAYRVVQEGLTNARKHAPGRPVTVTVDGAPGTGLHVHVRQPLPAHEPVDPAARIPGSGTGLAGLAERALLAGGTLDHGPVDGDYLLRARLPWER